MHRENQALIAVDPLASVSDDVLLPHDSIQELPVRFEVDRYGGGRLLKHSVGLFPLSSLDVFRFMDGCGRPTPTSRLAEAARAFLRYAWGVARDGEEFLGLLGYAAAPPSEELMRFVKVGDEEFDRRRDSICLMVREEFAALGGIRERLDDDPPCWTTGTRRLQWEIREAGDALRWRIGSSHIHMTANRLGLRVPEEIYLSRLLSRAARQVAEARVPYWSEAWEARRAQMDSPEPPLGELVSCAPGRFSKAASLRVSNTLP